MGTARKLALSDPNATKARLTPGRQWIGIKNLEAPDELQPRAGIDKDWVSQLEGFRRDGSEFPPARVYQLADGRLMLAEGHHRRWALLGAGEADMLCEVVDGTMEDAIEHAAGSNKSNGVKPMGPKDVTKAIEMLLTLDRWWTKNNASISHRVGCGPNKVVIVRTAFAEKYGRALPDMTERIDGKHRPRRFRSSFSRDYRIVPGSDATVRAHYKGVEYSGATEEKLKMKLSSVFKEEDCRRRSLKFNNMNMMLRRHGFSTARWTSAFPSFGGWLGHGIIVVSCEFGDKTDLLKSEGLLKLLLIAVGRLDANKQKYPLGLRQVILCFREDGPLKAIELFEEAGIEFMTPDELIRSLGANGMTPDEVQASLKEKTE